MKLFSGENDLAIMNNIIEGKIYPPSYFRDDVPAGVEAILMKALEKDRRRRYQSACDMQLDIDTFLAGHEFTPSSIHLANFMKQLFKDELAAEKERRMAETPTTPPRFSQPKGDKLRANPPPPPVISENSRPTRIPSGDSDVFDVPLEIIEEETTKEGVMVRFNDEDIVRLRRLAEKQETGMAEIVRDIVSHYLKFQT